MAQTSSPKFYTKSGNLTTYAFACGYTERAGDNGDIVLSGFLADRICYRLTWFEPGNISREETYRSIKVARKAFTIVKSADRVLN